LRHLAHEFNNLFTGATLYCDLLIAGLQNDPRLLRYANEVRLATEQGATLVSRLRELAAAHAAIPNHVPQDSTLHNQTAPVPEPENTRS